MKLFTRLQDENSIIKNENGDITALVVQTYKTINVEGLQLEKFDTFNGEPCEPYILVKSSDKAVRVRERDITNFTNPDSDYLEKNNGVFISQGVKSGKQFKLNGLPCKVMLKGFDLYACIDYDLVIYNVSKIK